MEEEKYLNNSKGDKLSVIFSIVNEDKLTPIIILCHGLASHKNGSMKKISLALNDKGINTIRFDFYGHGKSERKFEDITVSEGVDNIECIIKNLRGNKFSKIGLLGSSFGGACCIIVAANNSDIILLALKSPVADYLPRTLMTKTKNELIDWRLKGEYLYRKEGEKELKLNYSFYEDIKNINGFKSATKIEAPTLIVHGDKDESVPLILSEMLTKAITNSKLKVINGADHRYNDPKLEQQASNAIIEFIVSELNN